jgi:hypothetical protein
MRRSEFATVRGGGRDVVFLVCGRCGHVYQSPRKSDDELATYYASGYRAAQQGSEEPTEKDLLMQAARARLTVDLLGERLHHVARHLDLGSSSGALMQAMQGRFRCETVGVEPGQAYREHCRERGLRVFPSQADLQEAQEAAFDLVTAMHVLEHVPDPVGMLTSLRTERMTPGAYLVLEVPNLAEHAALEEAHLHAFTPSSLKDAVARAGFRILWARCHGGFRSPILRLYITLLAVRDDHPPAPRYLPWAAHRSRFARRFGEAKRRLLTRIYPDWTWQSPERVVVAPGKAPPDA